MGSTQYLEVPHERKNGATKTRVVDDPPQNSETATDYSMMEGLICVKAWFNRAFTLSPYNRTENQNA